MTFEKAEFERWARNALYPDALLQWSEAHGGYYLGITSDAAWKAWNAAYRTALEESAKVCDRLKNSEAWECAEEIRALIKD
jgi:hypothetical protein